VERMNPRIQGRIGKLSDFVLETHGRAISTTARIACNKIVYLINRVLRSHPQNGLLHAEWHWAKYPFLLRGRILWSKALRCWFVPEDESSIECMLHMPAYEPIDWVSPKQGECFLDAGGYVGWYSIQAGRAVGNGGRVVVLEPDALNRRQLERNLALNEIKNAEILPLAIWSHSGKVGWRHGEEPVWHQVKDGGEGTQEAISIDELVDQLRLTRLDWVKLDIEGGEVEALQGASRTLRELRPRLFIEVHETTAILGPILKEAGYAITNQLYDQPPDRHGWMLAESS
jgi:FkbM family methyltransferase